MDGLHRQKLLGGALQHNIFLMQLGQPLKGTVPNPPGTKALAKLAAGVALAAVHTAIPRHQPTCHKWLTSAGCANTKCNFKHPPEHKGRTDLLPLCPEAVGSSCPRLAAGQRSMYRHDGIALMGVPVLPTGQQGAATGGSTVEMALVLVT